MAGVRILLGRAGPATLLAAALCASAAAGDSLADTAADHEVKAAFLLNFTRFVEWPATAFGSAQAPFVIGVVGGGEVERTLAAVTRDRMVNGRPFEVRRVDARSAKLCQVVFIPDSEMDRAGGVMAAVAQAPVLLVGESEGFTERGGVVNFVVRDRRVRFEIDPAIAAGNGLKISARLLQLAILTGNGAGKK